MEDEPEGVEDVAAGGEAVEVLVGERAEVLVADGADRPCGGAGHGGVVVGGGGCGRWPPPPPPLLVVGFGRGGEKKPLAPERLSAFGFPRVREFQNFSWRDDDYFSFTGVVYYGLEISVITFQIQSEYFYYVKENPPCFLCFFWRGFPILSQWFSNVKNFYKFKSYGSV